MKTPEPQTMQILQTPLLFVSVTLVVGGAFAAADAPTGTKQTPAPAIPTHIGILGLPQFVGLDAYGPIEFFQSASFMMPGLKVSVVSEKPGLVYSTAQNTNALVPASTIGLQPDIDVLLIPGGPAATREAAKNPEILNYVRNTFPKLKYLLSVCSGARVAAAAGVLDGRNATSNKLNWKDITPYGPKTNWISHARWVVDGNVWTSSGITAGMDMTHSFIAYVYQNQTLADRIADVLEHNVIRNASYDPFADRWGAKDVPPIQL